MATTPSNASILTGQQSATSATQPIYGTSAQRPANPGIGQLYYDTTLAAEIVWNGTAWGLVSPSEAPVPGFGNTGGHPATPYNGFLYYNTDLGGLEAWNGTAWILIGPVAGLVSTSVTVAGTTTTTHTTPVTSNTTTYPPPAIVTQPASLTVSAASSASFTVAATGTGSLAYQWYFNNVAIGGATANTYTIGSAAQSNGGNYYVVVTNSNGSTQSNTVTLTVNGAPYITVQPTSQSVTANQSVSFSVQATGTGPLTYQWYANSNPISGATGTTYTNSNVQVSNAGSYYVVVTGPGGTATSNSVTLTVAAANQPFTCTSFNAICTACNTANAYIGFSYQASSSSGVTVSLACLGGNLPPGTQLTAYDSNGNSIQSATGDGSSSQVSVSYNLTGSAFNTAVVTCNVATPPTIQIAVTVTSGPMVINECSCRATVYGPVVFSPNGLGMQLQSTTVAANSVATANFLSIATGNPQTAPYYTWNFNGNTNQNPLTNFDASGNITLVGLAGGGNISDSILQIMPPQ